MSPNNAEMAGTGVADWVELYQLMQERYPDLPLHEAYVNLLHDSFIKLPKEAAETIIPILPHLAQQSPEIAESFGILCGYPLVTFCAQMARIIRNTTAGTLKPRAGKTTANTSNTLDLASSAVRTASDTVPRSAEAVAASVKFAAENMERVANSADYVVRQTHGIHVIGKSLVDHTNYYGRWMQTVSAIQIAQGHQATQVLTDIRDHLGESNSITVSGSGGPDGFAQHVYDFIKEGIDEINEAERDNHRFFVYNPDTNWYPAFHRLIRQNPLPPTFCAKSDDLDTFCRYMQDVRAQLNGESECGQDIIFHLLIPSWYRISIKEPLHFPDYLQPFQVEGRKHKGKPLVEFNLPAAPAGLLHGVANVLDPKSLNMVALGVSVATTLPMVGWGVNGACLAVGLGLGTITGLGPLIAIPAWLGTAVPAMTRAAPAIDEAVYGALCEEAPRVLGSNQRLDMAP